MAFRIRGHRIAAIIVLISAAVWVVTGKFSSVGSEEAHAAQPAPGEQPVESKAATDQPLRTVGVIAPEFVEHARRIRVSGLTEADKNAVLAARASGVIASLKVEKGSMVSAGEVVLSIEGPEVLAAVETARATLAQRQQELQIAESLFKSGTGSELQLIRARADAAAAEAALVQAEAAADRLNVVAPFEGFVDSVEVEQGEWIQAGTPVARILSLDPIIVLGEISEIEVGHVRIGDKAEVRLVNGLRAEGVVRHVAREASPQTRTYPVEVSLPNTGGKVPSGMTAEISLFTAPVRAVVVPRSVITLSDDGELGLRVVGEDNIARFAPVELIDDTPRGLVLAGVPEDVRIIVLGQDLVRDGERVAVSDVAAQISGN
ncbi:multidrug efflux system membrane fusion protein [Albidovulum inexpectatum]|uniref:Multidrug efflux system membrane fusion protein n=1 Tax=Albidovulum inexpectatum TaxID=196587 RepID=A0A2S5JDD5_9RHOB|nr:efflux RND transporter periplasmic adaptor subunit [Albidovulum inexpectatum]PPB79502.1 multidrug efflux system membrane fusion protein [Albidovulum inexpectatum]